MLFNIQLPIGATGGDIANLRASRDFRKDKQKSVSDICIQNFTP